MFKDKDQLQQKILYLLISDNNLITKFISAKIDPEEFDPAYRVLLHAIFLCHTKEQKLTKNIYEDIVHRFVNDGSYEKITGQKIDGPKTIILKEIRTFINVCDMNVADKNDFELFVNNFKENVTRSKTSDLFNEFQEKSKKNYDFYQSIAELSDGLQKLSYSGASDKFSMIFFDETSKEFIKELKEERANPKKLLSCGYKEIDKAIGVGLDIGTLTLFVADVGGYKSTMMMNIALNIFKQYEQNVLYVSLEMPAHMLKKRMICRETGLWFDKLTNPHEMTDEEMNKVELEVEKWEKNSHRYAILDTKDRLAVSDIKSAIESYVSFFKPRVVFVDYISILTPEKSYARLNSHEWIGFMCKDLRQMGRKYGFAIVSAAQLGRDAIKRLRSQKEGAQSVGSEDIRASHDFSADSDNIFALVPDPNEPDSKLQVFCIKARYGDKTFDGQGKIKLDVKRKYGRILSYEDASWNNSAEQKDAAVKHGESIASKISFDDNLDLDDFDETPKISGSIKVSNKDFDKNLNKKKPNSEGSFD